MKTLSTEFRRQLERTVIEARDVAEAGARVALEALAIQHHEPYGHMGSEQRTQRRRLRAHARQLGDRPDARSGGHGIDHLVHECAYEHWHGMLFARFLAENHLLIEPEMGVAITLDECEELAKEESVDKWSLAARFAHHMLRQAFRTDHPVFEVQFAREHRLKLEGLVEGLTPDVFTATDSLGWVYQFWQTKKKDEVNRSEVKIGADELLAVTQLFTEPYMVQFLLHNSLGAWWTSRHLDKPCPVDLTYLRKTEEGALAAGGFGAWPDNLSEFRLLDPCCGSGHFLVAAFLMLVPMRMDLEELSAAEAVDAVLHDNLHGLELDQRSVAIAAFALALEAWRYADAGGFRTLPKINLAWCGQPVAGKREQWLALADGDTRLEAGMAALYDTFRDAPILGSLIDPTRSVSEDMLTAGFVEVQPLLEKALREHSGDEDWEETAIAARGLFDAARLLAAGYDLVVTNPPYLTRGKQGSRVMAYCDRHHQNAKNDLANVFLERCRELCHSSGVTQLVLPQSWLFLTSYKNHRIDLLTGASLNLVARLGSDAFETISGEIVSIVLVTVSVEPPRSDSIIYTIDASNIKKGGDKATTLKAAPLGCVNQRMQLDNPNHVISLSIETEVTERLGAHATSSHGQGTFDRERFVQRFWERSRVDNGWVYQQGTPEQAEPFAGCHFSLLWEEGSGQLAELMAAKEAGGYSSGKWKAGTSVWGKRGVLVGLVSKLPSAFYLGGAFDANTAAVIPNDDDELPGLWKFAETGALARSIRKHHHALYVPPHTLLTVPYESDRWRREAHNSPSAPVSSPYTTDSTQWIFHGHPCETVKWDEQAQHASAGSRRMDGIFLQVAFARFVGYEWPAEIDQRIDLTGEARAWVEKAKVLKAFADDDGIVCIPAVRGERPAHERLLQLLQAAWGDDWNDGILSKLLADAGSSNLDDWLRNGFFEHLCKLFRHRPFIWHIWYGRKRDGFHALVNYHKLAEGDGKGRRLLESLAYSLGDWIARQQDSVKRGEGGAEDRLTAAVELQKRLVAILEGEPPFGLFVRWKPIEEQPIGWEPDINNGVHLNIRPFMAQDLPGGKKGAGILRAKPNVHWKKDRGKEPVRDQTQYPWFWEDGKFTGERVNAVHLTLAEKRAARDRAREET